MLWFCWGRQEDPDENHLALNGDQQEPASSIRQGLFEKFSFQRFFCCCLTQQPLTVSSTPLGDEWRKLLPQAYL